MGEQSKEFSHFNHKGEVRMVDIGDKPMSVRIAVAEGNIYMQTETLEQIVSGGHKKGDVLGIARTAGIMAAKRTADLIPLCHPLSLTRIDIELVPDTDAYCVRCRGHVETRGRTGVEMEALLAVQIALLTIYDMCKAVDRGMQLSDIRLLEKHGGRSGSWVRE